MNAKNLIVLFDLADWENKETQLINQISKLANEKPKRLVIINTNNAITERIMRYLVMIVWLGTETFIVESSFEPLMNHSFVKIRPSGSQTFDALTKEVDMHTIFEKRCGHRFLCDKDLLVQLPCDKSYHVVVKRAKATLERYERVLRIFNSFISAGHCCGISYANN